MNASHIHPWACAVPLLERVGVDGDAVRAFLARDVFYNHDLGMSVVGMAQWTCVWALVTIAVCVALDFAVVRRLTRAGDANHRWFFMHVLFNAYVVWHCLDATVGTLTHPLTAWATKYDPASQANTAAIVGFHIYHGLMYKLTTEDIIHHAVSTGIVAVVGILLPWGILLGYVRMVGKKKKKKKKKKNPIPFF
jgi:hypothetical protein